MSSANLGKNMGLQYNLGQKTSFHSVLAEVSAINFVKLTL